MSRAISAASVGWLDGFAFIFPAVPRKVTHVAAL